MKAIAFFIIGALFGLTVSELLKDAKPVQKIVIYDGYRMRYDYPHYYRGGYDYYYRPLEYRVGGQSNTRNDGERRGGGGGTERGETHTTTKEVYDRKKSWGTKY